MPATAPAPGQYGTSAGRRAQDGGVHPGGNRQATAHGAADGAASTPGDSAHLETGATTMSEPSWFDETALPLVQVRRIDAICGHFEKAWRAASPTGLRP